MLSANEIRNVRFSTAMGGYKKEEVDVLLDKVESDYELFERTLRDMNDKINELKSELEESKNASGSIQNVLISAQRLADQIVEEAKKKSREIIESAEASIVKISEQEKELTNAFDKKAGERKDALQSDIEKIIANAENRYAAVETATQDCIDRQQLLFDDLTKRIAAFRAEITAKYKEHLELLASLPDTLPSNPTEVAAEVAKDFDNVPTVTEYVENPQRIETAAKEEETIEEPMEKPHVSTGFVINADEFDIDEDQDTDDEF